jgi:hypothetical protein
MENQYDAEWQIATNKKKSSTHEVHQKNDVDVIVNKNEENAFSLLSADNEKPPKPEKPTIETKSWGDDDIDLKPIISILNTNLENCEDCQQRTQFLKDVMGLIAERAANIIIDERQSLNNNNMNDKETLKGLHELSQFGSAFSKSMTDTVSVINDAVNSIEKQKKDILDGWNKFVQEMNPQSSPSTKKTDTAKYNNTQLAQSSTSFLNAFEGGKRTPTSSVPRAIATKVITVGLEDIKCPTTTSTKDIPLMAIQYNTTLNTFLINLDGTVYSFGYGNFISRKTKNESTLYGKRCNPRSMTCKDAECTYFHDPLLFPTNSHSERNMAVSYITEDLIKSIGTDQDILANTLSTTNPFIVEDIVQLAGMLLLKALAVKKICIQSSSKSSKSQRH